MIKTTMQPPNTREVKKSFMSQIANVIPKKPKGVLTGIHESAGKHNESNKTVATIGAINHFGADNIPARPWLDVGVQSGEKEYKKAIVQTVKEGKSLDDAVELVAVLAQSATQLYVRNLQIPPNAPSTIKKKGSSNPLIDTGQMIGSITSVVVDKLPQEGEDV